MVETGEGSYWQFSPMASPQAAAAGTSSYAHFSWLIENFSELNTKRLCSQVFYVGRSRWRISLYPGGNDPEHLSVYLVVADRRTLPLGWKREAQFRITVTNYLDLTSSVVSKDLVHLFGQGMSHSRGWTKLVRLTDLKDPEKGYLLNDTLLIEADVTVRSIVGYSLQERFPSAEGNKDCETGKQDEAPHPPEEIALAIPPDDFCTISSDQASVPEKVEASIAASSGNTVKFLSYRVSSEASLVLEKIHNLHKNTFTGFSMKAPIMQTAVLESFASFIKSMSTTKASEMNEEALCLAVVSVKDFEQVGLDLSWLYQRLDEVKRVIKYLHSLETIDSYAKDLEVALEKVCELKRKIAKAKAKPEALFPESLGINDYVLASVF